MLPKFRIPEIQEFMTAYITENCSVEDPEMKVHIPVLMPDSSPGKKPYTIGVESGIFISTETIRASSTLTSWNYIVAEVSPLMKLAYPLKTFAPGDQVRVYIPNFNLHKIVIVPL